jgi:hypothetical protein
MLTEFLVQQRGRFNVLLGEVLSPDAVLLHMHDGGCYGVTLLKSFELLRPRKSGPFK